MKLFRFWFILQQDVDRPVGGVKQIYAVASIIADLGYPVFVVQGTSEFRPSWFSSSLSNVNTVSAKGFSFKQLNSSIDIVVIPETFLPLLPKIRNLMVVIFNQNMHYLFGEKFDFDPRSVLHLYSLPNIVSVLTVSSSDYNYALDSLPISPTKIHRVVNAIEDHFSFSFSTSRKIAYMPRKNSNHSKIVRCLIEDQIWFKNSSWSFAPIDNQTHYEVARSLADSSLFLSFGYPEGFGLPVAEALVSGCPVVGYHGLGGSEILDSCKSFDVFKPVSFRDFHAFLRGVKSFVYDYQYPNQLKAKLSAVSDIVSRRYSTVEMVNSVTLFLDSLTSLS